MQGFITFIHVLVCLLLTIAILMQSGRGGGLTEQFAGAESMFGAKTSSFMIRITTILATIFLVTSLSLAHLSARQNQSLIPNTVTRPAAAPSSLPSTTTPSAEPVTTPAPVSTNATQ